MRSASFRLVGALVLGGLWALPATSAAGRCNQVTTVTSDSLADDTYSDLSDRPAVVCGVEFFANTANGSAVVFDSPSDLETHVQAVMIAEPGQSGAGNYDSAYYGEGGRPTRFGLDVLVRGGNVIIQWSGTAP